MKRDKCIFVSVASYRDDECANTINDCFLKAENPSRVFIGICQQNAENDKDCIYDNHNEIINKFKNNIRIIRIPFYEAKGPIYARFLCSSLLDKNNEDFYFQIDSHTIFIKNWDTILLSMIDEIKTLKLSLYPVISYYPKDFRYYDNDNFNNKNNQIVPVINNLIFDENKKVFKLGKAIFTNTNNNYIKTFYCAAGMFFCSSSFIDKIHFDTNLDYLFTGEEIINSIKFYTNGYDIFTPKINVIYHRYIRNDKPKFWNEPLIPYDDRKALLKVRSYIFDYNNNFNLNLGKIRNVDDFYKAININIDDFNYKKKTKLRICFFILFTIFLIFVFSVYWFVFLN